MSAEIKRLTGAGPIIADDPPKDVVELLEELLSEAKAGEIKSIGYFAVRGNDDVTTNWAAGIAPMNLMMAGAARLFQRVGNAVNDAAGEG